ncbi:MAG: transposase [Hydrogenophaga sp.]|uniref:IS66-like element accessory protein TnpA n=1 Tax=Hydrogenophaga sp. TaxID=1904254 RepID=UPI003D0E2CCC
MSKRAGMVCIKEIVHIMTAEMKSVAEAAVQPRRRNHSEQLKRELVQRSLLPGASVSALAMEHGINANLLFAWRRAHLRATASTSIAQTERTGDVGARLLPVEVVSEAKPSLTAVATAPAPRPNMAAGTIEIEMAGVRVRVRGMVCEDSLRTVLAALRASRA